MRGEDVELGQAVLRDDRYAPKVLQNIEHTYLNGHSYDGVASELIQLQAEADISLDPSWSLALNEFPKLNQPQTVIDETIAGFSNGGPWAGEAYSPVSGGQDLFLTVQTEDIAPTFSSTEGLPQTSITRDSIDQRALVKAHHVATQQSTRVQSQINKRPSKRKRLSSMFSRKKQHTDNELHKSDISFEHLNGRPNSSNTSDLLPSIPISTFPAVHKKDLDQACASQIVNGYAEFELRTRIQESGHTVHKTGIGDDIKVPSSDRRPMSWPRRHAFRKSLDISVAVLTRGFDKLRGDHGQSSP